VIDNVTVPTTLRLRAQLRARLDERTIADPEGWFPEIV